MAVASVDAEVPMAMAYRDGGHFWRALAIAAMIEGVCVFGFVSFSATIGSKHGPVQPSVMKISIQQPPPPPPVPKPQPPPPPKPVAQPLPPPPPPKPVARPQPKPLVRKIVPHTIVPPATPTVPQPPPAPAPAQPSADIQATAEQLYAAALNARVQSGLVVPQSVQMMGLSGTTHLAVSVAPSGAVLSVVVTQSSGAPPIDQAAMDAVHAASLPPFAADMPQHAITFNLTVRLSTQQN